MTINIISTQVNKNSVTGPKKVLENTLKGFDKLNIKYVFNKPINEYQFNWIHDSQEAIIEAGFVGKPVLVGPNIATLPKDLPWIRKKLPKNSLYLHPSNWTIDMWTLLGYKEINLVLWPTGVDLNSFSKIDRKNQTKILIYFKQRNLQLLEETKLILNKLNLEYEIIHYGFYKEEQYFRALQECRFGIWIGCSESQGIGLQEALATDLPLIIIDSTSIFDAVLSNEKSYFQYNFPTILTKIKTTTAPYFDARCGIKIYTTNDLEKSINTMLKTINTYEPRAFIEENLSLEKSTAQLIHFFEQMDFKAITRYNYQFVSKIIFYSGLMAQKWAWKLMWKKIFK